MPFEVSTELHNWLTTHCLGGYLQVYDGDAHPRALAIAAKIHPGTITNDILRTSLHLPRGREYDVEAPPQHLLEKYFGEYSQSAKAHRTHGGPNEFFGNLAHLLFEYSCVHTNPYSVPKKKASLIITAYYGGAINWGIITSDGVRAAITSFQSGKRFLPVWAQYIVMLYPPEAQPPRQPLLVHCVYGWGVEPRSSQRASNVREERDVRCTEIE